ncbi:hypothetical protein BT93_H3833 [Corymbia citriodora subsp. variegata]|nr:hypothetical protein BT93_H3833 [Corymbia citriodora subsp. variegata]
MATNPGNYKIGTTKELFETENATLLLIDYDLNQTVEPIKQGNFMVQHIVHALGPILIATCMVSTLQWPLTKDSSVIRVGRRSYVFGMPGIIYGLLFPEECSEDKLAHLDSIFTQNTHFEDHSFRKEKGLLYCKDSEQRFWMRSRARFHSVAHAILTGFGHLAGKSATAAAEGSSGNMKAFRLSGVTHLVGQAIISGALAPQHIETQEARRAAREMESHRVSTTNSIFAFPSINVFMSLVEAMEMLWVVALGRTHLLRRGRAPPPGDANFDCRMWKLREDGLRFFFNVMTGLEEILDNEDDDGVADDDDNNDDDDGDDSNDDGGDDGDNNNDEEAV